MGVHQKTLIIVADAEGRTISVFYEMATGGPTSRQKIFELPLYLKDSAWREGNPSLIGNIVLGALNLYPQRTEREVIEASRRNLAMITKHEEEERRGQWDNSSLKTRAELEFVEYSRTGNLQHFLKGESLYRRLAQAGSEEYVELMKEWDSKRERLLRWGGGESNTEE